MNENIIRCRCGHRVLGREVLRTEFYERRSFLSESIREYVYVKYRCKRCKRMGESFIPDSKWDWKVLETQPNELNDIERDFFLDEEPISTQDILDLHANLENVALFDELQSAAKSTEIEAAQGSDATPDPFEDEESASSTRCSRSSDSRLGESRLNEPRVGEQRPSEQRPGESRGEQRPSESSSPPKPPLASDDSSRKS